jgi:multicomponent Na+:H+ antiporter subunit E
MTSRTQVRISWSTIVSRGVLFSLLWWVLTDGAAASWWIGVPAVLLAVAAGVALLPPTFFVWVEFLRFVPFFLMRSLLGGADVAWRVFHPALPISPDLIEYPLRLSPGLPRVFMANTVSLLPGTLSASLDRSVLKVHVLDNRRGVLAELEAVEQRVARMFGTSHKLS